MTHTVNISTTVGPDRTVTIELPASIPLGPARLTLSVETEGVHHKLTASELADSEYAGDWADRDDLPLSSEEFAAWRRRLWERTPVVFP